MPRYRPNVALILRNAAGEILVCERSDWPGCWQFPQGGVKKGEGIDEALVREVEEELGLKPKHYRIVSSKGPYRYLFPDGFTKKGYEGQEQQYFLADIVPGALINIAGDAPEFRDIRWVLPSEYSLDWVSPMKREIYAEIFRDFFSVALLVSENR